MAWLMKHLPVLSFSSDLHCDEYIYISRMKRTRHKRTSIRNITYSIYIHISPRYWHDDIYVFSFVRISCTVMDIYIYIYDPFHVICMNHNFERHRHVQDRYIYTHNYTFIYIYITTIVGAIQVVVDSIASQHDCRPSNHHRQGCHHHSRSATTTPQRVILAEGEFQASHVGRGHAGPIRHTIIAVDHLEIYVLQADGKEDVLEHLPREFKTSCFDYMDATSLHAKLLDKWDDNNVTTTTDSRS